MWAGAEPASFTVDPWTHSPSLVAHLVGATGRGLEWEPGAAGGSTVTRRPADDGETSVGVNKFPAQLYAPDGLVGLRDKRKKS